MYHSPQKEPDYENPARKATREVAERLRSLKTSEERDLNILRGAVQGDLERLAGFDFLNDEFMSDDDARFSSFVSSLKSDYVAGISCAIRDIWHDSPETGKKAMLIFQKYFGNSQPQ